MQTEMESWDSLVARAKAIADLMLEELAEIRRRQAADLYLATIGLRLDEVRHE